jgi:hypothetical protein
MNLTGPLSKVLHIRFNFPITENECERIRKVHGILKVKIIDDGMAASIIYDKNCGDEETIRNKAYDSLLSVS